MLKLSSDYSIESELLEVCNLFFDVATSELIIDCCFMSGAPYICINGKYFYIDLNTRPVRDRFSRMCKTALYKTLSDYTGQSFSWGALTGVRPTKLGYEIKNTGEAIVDGLMKYQVSRSKAELVERIINNQKGYSPSVKKINFYIHVPFCVSRCNYCSFVSLPTKNNEKLMRTYVEYLIKEIRQGVYQLERCNYDVDSIYIGGGTPTALNEELLNDLLDSVPYKNIEYTVEAGRPDTITEEKIDIMKQHGVTRLSINPQSFSDKTLSIIGRSHTSQDIIDAYNKCKGKFAINMDLIAGLTGEDITDFNYTLTKTLELRPENITVHTLSKKNGSILKNEDILEGKNIAQMIERAYSFITKDGYEPYYLYRQKNMIDNLENIGYALPGTFCVNNITTMEEFYSVFACGAGAISKRLFEGNRIERFANVRDVRLYIEQFEERLEKKTKFFS